MSKRIKRRDLVSERERERMDDLIKLVSSFFLLSTLAFSQPT